MKAQSNVSQHDGSSSKSRIEVMLDKRYDGAIDREGQDLVFRGEVTAIPWTPLESLASGVAMVAAGVLRDDVSSITRPVVVAVPDGFRAGFWIEMPSSLTAQEIALLLATLQVFAIRIQDVAKEMALEAVQHFDAAAVEVGFKAAEVVRRAAPRSNLTSVVVVRVHPMAETVTVGPKIGRHPDPEFDREERPYFGRILAVDDDRSRIVVYVPPAPHPVGTTSPPSAVRRRRRARGTKVTIQFDARVFSLHSLAELMVARDAVCFIATPKVRAGRERLTLQRIE